MNKFSFALFAALLAAAAAPVLAELPDAATALAMIRERRAADDPQTATNGPSLQDLYGAYRALPLDAPPAREAESWLVLLDKLRETEDYNAFGQLCSGWRSGFLAPFFKRLPAAEAWPAVREGLSTRAAASTNAAPLLDALQYVFDRLAHDEPAASNHLGRLRTAAHTAGAEKAFRNFESHLNRKGRLPEDVERYFESLAGGSEYMNIPSVFLRLPANRLWQLTAPVLTNNLEDLDFETDDSGATPPALLALAQSHLDALAAAPGFSLVDHTPAGRGLYESLLKRFDFLATAAEMEKRRNGVGAADEDEAPENLSADALAALLARAEESRKGLDGQEGYDNFKKASVRVVQGILSREGFPAACAFAARFPTNFFRAAYADSYASCSESAGVAEMDFLERFVLGGKDDVSRKDPFDEYESIWGTYAEAAMRCGQTARARAFIEKRQKGGRWNARLSRQRLDLAAFDDDEAVIAALSREIREHLSKGDDGSSKYDDHATARAFKRLVRVLGAMTNRTELAACADLLLSNAPLRRACFGPYDSSANLLGVFDAAGLTDKAFEIAVAYSSDLEGGRGPFFKHVAILPLYRNAGRHADIVAFVEGDPDIPATNALRLVETDSNLTEIYAEALAKTGRGADAASIARHFALVDWRSPVDWPYRILANEMEPGAFIGFMDALYAADRFEERPLIWKAEVLRRTGRLEEAEAVARKAVEVDPTDGETRAGDRIRSYAVLADILDARGSTKEAEFLRGAVKAVRLAEEGDDLQECGLVRRSLAKYEEAEKHFSAAYCVQWRKAERLRELGMGEAAARHYEETFRQLPGQFGHVASLCFGCSGIFDSPGAVSIAERILTEAASAATPAPAACYLLGRLRIEQHRHEEAYEAFGRAAELAPDYLDALVAQNALRFRVRRPLAEWERIQARIFALDPLGRHSSSGTSEIIDWGLAKRLESEAIRRLPAPDFDSLRKIVFPAAAAKAAERGRETGEGVRPGAGFYGEVAANRKMDESPLVHQLSWLLDAMERGLSPRYADDYMRYNALGAAYDYDDLLF